MNGEVREEVRGGGGGSPVERVVAGRPGHLVIRGGLSDSEEGVMDKRLGGELMDGRSVEAGGAGGAWRVASPPRLLAVLVSGGA